MLAFVQRPNIYLRARLRNSLQDLSVMKKPHHHANAAHKKVAVAGTISGSGSGVRRGASGGWPGWAGLGLGPPIPPLAPAASTTTTTTEQSPPPLHTGEIGGSSRVVRGKPAAPTDFAGQPWPVSAGKTTREGDGGSVASDGRGGNSAIGGGSVPIQGACVGLHVRNGDAVTGEQQPQLTDVLCHHSLTIISLSIVATDIRNAAGHNLTLAAHMKCLETLTKEMGIYTLYLATDNNTLFEEAAKWYPQYRWYYQRRPLYAWTPDSPTYNFGTRK